jgi:hypothetical protein
MVQMPDVSQQPVHVVEQLGLPASTAAVGEVQILTGRVGACGIGPHVSPGATHSAVDVQSWRGPMGDEGHGPRWQAVVIMIVPQHTAPARHIAELVHVIPDAPLLLLELPPLLALPPTTTFPPLLALPPVIDPLLDPPPPLDSPLLEPALLPIGTLLASSTTLDASDSEAVSSLPPHPKSANVATATTRSAGPRQALNFTMSSRSSEDASRDYYLSATASPVPVAHFAARVRTTRPRATALPSARVGARCCCSPPDGDEAGRAERENERREGPGGCRGCRVHTCSKNPRASMTARSRVTFQAPMTSRTSVDRARLRGGFVHGLLGVAVLAIGACGGGDGSGGTTMTTAPPPPIHPTSVPTKMGFLYVWGSSDKDVWAVGDSGTAVHFDGQAWSVIPTGVTETLTCVHGAAPDDVWVSGADGDVLHWNGKAWSIDNQLSGTTLLGVWEFSPTNVWVSGVDQGGGFGSGSLFANWTGKTWTFLDINNALTLWKLWASGPTDIWMVGTDANGNGAVYRGNGKIFDPVPFKGATVHSIWGSGPDDVWVGPSTGAMQHWTGSGWTSVPELTTMQALSGISGSGRNDIWAVGQNGVIGHYGSNGAWTLSPSGTKVTLFGVWSNKPDEAWLVGGTGTVLRWTGTSWL